MSKALDAILAEISEELDPSQIDESVVMAAARAAYVRGYLDANDGKPSEVEE